MRFTVKLKLTLAFATVIVLSAITAFLGVSSLAAAKAKPNGVALSLANGGADPHDADFERT
jgi:hypothetical protein